MVSFLFFSAVSEALMDMACARQRPTKSSQHCSLAARDADHLS